MPIKPKLNVDEILKAEYEYIATTVFQANEDRSRVASFYFLSVGSLVAAILSAIFSTSDLKNVSLAFFGLFVVLTILGAVTLAQLARLRAAWHESVEAMNEIKDYYIKHNKEIEPAFKWRLKTLPPTDKPYSIANLMAVEVVVVGRHYQRRICLFSCSQPWEVLSGGGGADVMLVVGYFCLWAWYKHLLVDNQ